MPSASDELLRRLIASQNAQEPMVEASQPAMAPAVPTPAQVEVQPEVSSPLGSKLRQFLGGFVSTTQNEDPRIGIERERQKDIELANNIKELHAQKVSAPIIKGYLKSLPGMAPEVGQAIDTLDDDSLKRLLPKFGEMIKFNTELTDALTKSEAQKETARSNKAKEAIERSKIAQEVSQAPKAGKPSKAQESVDKEFGKDYNDFIVRGGYGVVRNQINTLKQAINDLESDPSISGPIRGALPDWARAFTNPKAINVKEQIAAIVQNSLRPILGPQFTEKEGENLIKRTYNDRLSPAKNAERAKNLLSQIETLAEQKKQAAEYYEQNGTLQGWQGSLGSIADLNPDKAPEAQPTKPNQPLTPEQRRARIEFLRAKQAKAKE